MGHQGRAIATVLLGLLPCACQYHVLDLFGDEIAPPPDLSTAELTPIINDSGPGVRWAPGLAYDAVRGTVVLYGGGAYFGEARADMWELDGDTWHLVCDPCAPGPLRAAVFEYDVNRQRFVLFGGSTDNTDAGAVGAWWTYDANGWTAHGATGPSARWGTAHGFDAARDALLVYGGASKTSEMLDDLWELHGDTWTVMASAPSPGPRAFSGGAYVQAAGSFAVYGGTTDEWSIGFDDLWIWDGAAWSQACDACTGTARWDTALVAVRGGALLQFGGYQGTVELAGTRYFTGTALKPLLPVPSARDSMGVTYDSGRSRVIIVGGNGDGCGGGDCSDVYQLTFR